MTPRELWIVLEAALDERRDRAHERLSAAVTGGWLSAALQRRAGRLHGLHTVLPPLPGSGHEVARERRQTVDEKIAAMKAWGLALGGNTGRVPGGNA